ncbi:MAG: MBOAT family protein, partial [Rectinema sp.]|nr:MBOAT family protein [Rectinema sp.]
MLFNSYTFVIFFALTLAAYAFPLSWRVRKFNLLWLSYIFYAAWNPPFVVLLWFSTVLDWFCGRWVYSAGSRFKRKLALVLSLAGNLGMLGFFKYGGFLLENFTTLLNAFGMDFHPAAPSVVLPVGISFYTFQTLSYTIDIYRGRLAPARSFLDYALFVTFFPQLVAGPIVRAADFLPQCEEPKRTSSANLGWGMSLMVSGLFLKMAVADGVMAPMVEAAYDRGVGVSAIAAWIGTLAFSMQIFCDFAGYSYCALGAAACMGFRLPTNFRAPYAAIGFSDFWRRWHISLSTWLRDYLY